jgi:hypothetical protein
MQSNAVWNVIVSREKAYLGWASSTRRLYRRMGDVGRSGAKAAAGLVVSVCDQKHYILTNVRGLDMLIDAYASDGRKNHAPSTLYT